MTSKDINCMAPSVPESEPVAWMVKNGFVCSMIYRSKKDADNYAADQQKRHDLSGSLASFCVIPLYTAPPAPSVPDGWRAVPLSATVEMRNAGRAHLTGITSYSDSKALQVYGAMLAAAPTPAEAPADVAKAVAAEREACAKACEQRKIITPEWQLDQHYNQGASHCAAAIRARGEKDQA